MCVISRRLCEGAATRRTGFSSQGFKSKSANFGCGVEGKAGGLKKKGTYSTKPGIMCL